MSLTNPDISIIVPIYNAEKYIEKCILSLLNQTHKNIELLCINDGSKDESEKIINQLSKMDSRIRIFNQPNSGPATARNLGLKNAKSPYIMFCDSDDWYEPKMCEKMLNAIQFHKVDFVICDANFHEDDQFHKRSLKSIVSKHKLKHFGHIQLNEKIKSEIFVVLWNKIFKKEIIDKNQITFPDHYEFDDDSFIYQYLSASNRFFGLKLKLYNYLVRSNSLMAKMNFNQRYVDVVKSLAHTLTSVLKNKKSTEIFFINTIVVSKITWFLENLSPETRFIFLELVNSEILSQLPENFIDQSYLLKNIKQKNYNVLVKRTLQTKKFLGLTFYKKKENFFKSKYYFFGLQFLKKSKGISKTTISVVGLPILKISHNNK